MKGSLSVMAAAAASLFLEGCGKSDAYAPSDPNTNPNGESFNCLIDGTYWSFKQETYTNHDALTAQQAVITQPGYRIEADDVTGQSRYRFSLWMLQESFPSKGEYALTTYGQGAYAEVQYSDLNQSFTCTTTLAHPGRLVFTKRTAERLEGTFSFDAMTADSSRVIHVTNGTFSIIP